MSFLKNLYSSSLSPPRYSSTLCLFLFKPTNVLPCVCDWEEVRVFSVYHLPLSVRFTVFSVLLSHPLCSAVSVKSWSGSDLQAGSWFQPHTANFKVFGLICPSSEPSFVSPHLSLRSFFIICPTTGFHSHYACFIFSPLSPTFHLLTLARLSSWLSISFLSHFQLSLIHFFLLFPSCFTTSVLSLPSCSCSFLSSLCLLFPGPLVHLCFLPSVFYCSSMFGTLIVPSPLCVIASIVL